MQGQTIVFDESHDPLWGNVIDQRYANMSTDLQAQGYTVQNMSVWNWAQVMAADVLVIVTHDTSFSASERRLLYEFVANGGGLFIIGERQNVGAEVALEYSVIFAGDAIEDENDFNGSPYWIIWNQTSNFGDHPITAGVSRFETYLGDGFRTYPLGGTPIVFTDADDHSRWYFSGEVASGIATVVAFEDHNGLGRIVVAGDSDSWTNEDTDGDGTTNYFDSDNEILARNIIDWLAHPSIPEKIIVTYSLRMGATPTDYPIVLFDESHSPWDVIDSDNDGIFGYEDDGSPFGDLAQIIEGSGCIVTNMSRWRPLGLEDPSVFITINPTDSLNSSELDDLKTNVMYGSGLLIIGESTTFAKTGMLELARAFGVTFFDGVIADTDENFDGNSYWPRYSGANLANHPINNGVDEVVWLHGDALNGTPAGATNLVVSDSDSTSVWNTPPPGSPSAQNQPVATAFTYGLGRVVVLTDMSLFYNTTSDPLLTYGNNALFAINIVQWLAETSLWVGEFYSGKQHLKSLGYGVKAMDVFNTSFFADADALVIGGSYDLTPSAIAAIVDYTKVAGNGLLLLSEWGVSVEDPEVIAEEFGFEFVSINGRLYDDDDNNGKSIYTVLLEGANIQTHPITTGVNTIIWHDGTGFATTPSNASILLRCDDDGTTHWYGGGAAANDPLMAALEAENGRVVVSGDRSLWFDFIIQSIVWETNTTATIRLFDHQLLLENIMAWLTANRAPSVHVDAPNGGETLSGNTTISWTIDDLDGDSLTFDIAYSPDDGSTWHDIITGATGTHTSMQWNTLTVPNSNLYRIRIIVYDGITSSEDLSDAVFTVYNAGALLPPPLILILAAAVIIIIVVIIVIFFFLRRRGTKTE